MAINSYPEIEVDKLPTPGDDMPGVKDVVVSGYVTDEYTHSGTIPAGLYKFAVNSDDPVPTGLIVKFKDNKITLPLHGKEEQAIRLTTSESNLIVRSGYYNIIPYAFSSTVPFTAFAFGSSTYILTDDTAFLGGYAGIRISTNAGAEWQQFSESFLASVSGSNIQNVKFLNDRFFLLAGSSKMSQSTNKGITWTTISSVAGAETGASFFDMAFTTGNYVVVGNFTGNFSASHSTDLVSWTTKDMGVGSMNSVVFAEGLFVAVGNSGMVRTSTNGVTWTQRTSNATGTLNTVVHDGAKFYAAQNSSRYWIESTDGITWSTKEMPFLTNGATAGSFTAATDGTAYYAVGPNSRVYYSTNFTDWDVEQPSTYVWSATLNRPASGALLNAQRVYIYDGKVWLTNRNDSTTANGYPNNSRGLNVFPSRTGVEFYLYSTDLSLKDN